MCRRRKRRAGSSKKTADKKRKKFNILMVSETFVKNVCV